MKPSKINYGAKNGKSIFERKPTFEKVEYSQPPNIEADTEIELTSLQVAFRDKAKKEQELKDKNTSSDFWSCIIFKNEEQRNQFCELLSLKEEDNQYIDGQAMIKALELKIQTMEEKAPGKFRCNKEILSLSIDPNLF